MNLDKLIILFVSGLLPLLFLPFPALTLAVIFSLFFAILCLWHKKWALSAIVLIWAFSFYQAEHHHRQSTDFSPHKINETLLITQILKQQDYQTAIAERPNKTTIFIHWKAAEPLRLQARYQANFTLRPLYARQNLGNFDRLRWLFAHRLSGQATINNAKLIDNQENLRHRWLHHTQSQIDRLSTKGIILALAFGERAWIDPHHWQQFQQTATAHLIAISGLHIALIATIGLLAGKGILYFCWQIAPLARFFRKPFGAPFSLYFPLVSANFAAFGYAYLAGFSAPTSRALFALIFISLCRVLKRHYTAWQLWWRVVALLLLIEPFNLLSDSFWLSILAVAGLISWYQFCPLLSLNFRFSQMRPIRWLIGLLHLQMGILLIFTPVQLYFFEGLSAWSFVANLLIVPLFSLIIVPLILFSLLSNNYFHTFQLADYLLTLSLRWLESFSHAWISLSPSTLQLFIFCNVLTILLLYGASWLIKRKKSSLSFAINWHFVLATLLCFFTACTAFFLFPSAKSFGEWVHFDIGQGLAMGFRYQENGQEKMVLYDTGASWQESSMAELEILPYLQRHKIDLAAIILSHDDNDHSGGVPILLQHYPNAKIITPSHQTYGAKQIEPCIAGKRWQFGNFLLNAIHPAQISEYAHNAHSCVILGEIGKHRFLLTGDSGKKEEWQYASQIGKIDFLQLPHHGSKTSSSEMLLHTTSPTLAIASTARYNRWKMPHSIVVDRLKQNNITLLNTAEQGMIRIRFYPRHYQIETARSLEHVWYRYLPPQAN